MKKVLMLFTVALAVMSCEKETTVERSANALVLEDQFTGVVFENWEDFSETYENLAGSNSEEYVLNWIYEQGHSSLYLKAIDYSNPESLATIEQLTPSFLAIFNSDFKFKVGEEIILFKDSKFYAVTNDASTNAKKENSSKLNLIGAIKREVISSSEITKEELTQNSNSKNSNIMSEVVLGVSSSGTQQQWHDFKRNAFYECGSNRKVLGPSSRNMRYFHQLISNNFYIGPLADVSELYIQFKLFWRNSRNKLRYAEVEQMNYDININGTLGFGPVGFPTPRVDYENINLNVDLRCVRYPKWYNYRVRSVNWTKNSSPKWRIDASGTITHHINGDLYSNRWNAPINWRGTSSGSGGTGGTGGTGDGPVPIGGGGIE